MTNCTQTKDQHKRRADECERLVHMLQEEKHLLLAERDGFNDEMNAARERIRYCTEEITSLHEGAVIICALYSNVQHRGAEER